MPDSASHNLDVRRAWDANAEFWDEQMGDGNDFFQLLIWPAVERLLELPAGGPILDVACGNGLTSRRLAALRESVIGIDFSERMIEIARRRGGDREIDYRVVDATDRAALLALGEESFARVLCNMALMDMADVEPLMSAVARLLRPGGAFVFSVLHPCFNNPAAVQMAELEERGGSFVTTYSVKISRYRTPYIQTGAAMHGQPEPHPYFHRSLADLLAPGLGAGLVLDALEERAFPPDYAGGSTPLSWSGRFGEIPPILVARLRRGG
jgi:2-polyprenyl-3-methyl-5-hydroxy-6-metoxy-1,4-benzoquinol methylase